MSQTPRTRPAFLAHAHPSAGAGASGDCLTLRPPQYPGSTRSSALVRTPAPRPYRGMQAALQPSGEANP